ncbi:MAG: hypothetical protein KatS3mg022_0711 [Armatimonadota bacterium]|nr:MAG: hypothetical protein KatS3mg022_0711 [Armatimonadota bacterium]
MLRRVWLPLLAASCVVLTIGWGLAQSPDVVRLPVVFTESEAVMVAPPEFVAPPEVVDGKWSSDGRYAIVVRRYARLVDPQNPPEQFQWSILVWDNRQKRAVEVWKGTGGQKLVSEIQWMAGAPVALLKMHGGVREVAEDVWEETIVFARVHAASGTLKILGEPDRWKEMNVSPVKPFALLLGEQSYQVLRADGTLSAPIPYEQVFVPGESRRPSWTWMFGATWTADGTKLVTVLLDKTPEGKPERKFMLIDPLSGTSQSVSQEPPLYEPAPRRLPLRVEVVEGELKAGDSVAEVRSAWLVGSKGRTLICADVQAADLTPTGEAVWYISQGAAWVTPLRKLTQKQYDALHREALRETVMSNAKQIGLALLMYVQDYDETFPPNTGNVQDILMPYVKNQQIFNLPGTSFFYLMNTNTLSSIDRPAETMAGYIQTPYGRAVIWVDGHVTWQSD